MQEAVRKEGPSSPLPTWHWQQQPTPTEHWPSLSSNITFLRSSGPGDVLYAEARERYIGRTTGYYQIDVTNQEGKLIATFESSVFRKGDNITFSLPQTSSDSGCPDTLEECLGRTEIQIHVKRMGRWFLSSDTKKVMTSFSLPFLYSTKENTKQR